VNSQEFEFKNLNKNFKSKQRDYERTSYVEKFEPHVQRSKSSNMFFMESNPMMGQQFNVDNSMSSQPMVTIENP
jgi:hypothetical protein